MSFRKLIRFDTGLNSIANANTLGPITTTFTTTTFANLVPITSGLFAYYNGSSWTGTQWSDLTTNGNHATTIGGTINTTTQNSITYLYGNTSARIRFPTSVLPSTYTLFHVAKYNGNTRQRIFDGVTNNWLSGFWDTNGIGNSGIAYHNQGWLGPSSGVKGSNNFLLSSDQKGLYRANGSVVGTGAGDSTHLSIMYGTFANEASDWAVSEIIVYNRELTTDEIERTESWLMDKYSAFTFTTSLTRSATHTAGTVTNTFGNVGLRVGVSNTAPSFLLDVNGTFEANNTSGVLCFASSGNVGIGTTSPSSRLTINSGAVTNQNMLLLNNAIGGVIRFNDEAHSIWGRRGFGGGTDVMEFHEYGSISFWTGGVLSNQKSRLSILNTDNIVFQFQQSGIDWKTDLYWDGDAYGFAFNYSNGPLGTGGYPGSYGVRGFIDPFWSNVRMNFTGQHRSHFKDLDVTEINKYVGLIVRSTGKYMSMNNEQMLSVGKDAISINESLPIVELTTTHKDKAVFGVVSNAEDPNKPRVDKFGCWGTPYNKESGDNRVFINGLGEGAIWVSNKNGNLENGDYITSSTIQGYGEKQDEEYICNYTVAKITMDCDFNPQLIPKMQPKKDEEGNNVLDTKGNMIFEETGEYEYEYDIRHIDEDGNIINEEEYDQEIHFIAAFIGVTYHSS